MTSILYPSHNHLATLVNWANEGHTALSDRESVRPVNGQDMRRTYSLRNLRFLIERLDMPVTSVAQLADVFHQPMEELSEKLLDDLLRTAGFYGYVFLSGGRWCVTPVKGRPLHALRETAQGLTSQQAARRMCVRPERVRKLLQDARETTGALSTTHLVAIAYRSGWLPTSEELRRLTESGPVAPGYLVQGEAP